MHEWGITKSVIDEIIRQSDENGIKKIERVCLSMGEEDHITPDSFESCFNILSKETALSGTILEIKKGSGHGIVIISIEGLR